MVTWREEGEVEREGVGEKVHGSGGICVKFVLPTECMLEGM